ncbi:MAG: nicotinate-nucleotide adenylyltransferase [Ignavibacteriales bacterium]|nr:nicotinate-nucleotide adenylyltransferase [Ignavibacteriales bacterium]
MGKLSITRLGIFGGAFNPPHVGHLITVEHVREKLQLGKVVFVPTGNPPHKPHEQLLDGQLRLQMVQLAIKGNKFFDVSDVEFLRKDFSYTVDTLKLFQQTYPQSELYLIIGADNFLELNTWKSTKEIFSLAQVVVMNRGGVALQENDFTHLVKFVNVPNIEISSSEIRKRIAMGKSVRYLVSEKVGKFILKNNLYHDLKFK